MDRRVIGYQKTEKGWEEILEPERGMLYTMAFILCTGCQASITGYGGPRYNSYCLKCYGEEKLKDFMRV